MSQPLPADRAPLELDDRQLLEQARRVMEREAAEVSRAAARLEGGIVTAARLVANCSGRLIVSGLGKSGHVGRKIAATLASLGSPSFFIHAAEAAHGDLGMVRKGDVALLLSYSGKTAEVVGLLPFFKRLEVPVIALTGDAASPLALEADAFLDASVQSEADPLNLAPTSSTTVQLALGDALAAVVARMRGLKSEDFALVHPAGTLGKKLLLRLSDVAGGPESVPAVRPSATVGESLFEISGKGLGATTVTDEEGRLLGLFTDGDLRRLLAKEGSDCLSRAVGDVMTRQPITASPHLLAAKALKVMEEKEISVLVLTEEDKVTGMVHLHQLLAMGLA